MNNAIIDNTYLSLCEKNSDINEHLPTLKQYADECSHVTEMGVRWVVSTWAFLASNCDKIISYDIKKYPSVSKIEEMFLDNDRFIFIEKDVLTIDIKETDLLFIDTLHTYVQLSNELEKHSKSVRKYIILHDTVTFGEKNEPVYNHVSPLIKKTHNEEKGLRPAIEQFLEKNDGLNWIIHEHHTNNNGLTILKRINIP